MLARPVTVSVTALTRLMRGQKLGLPHQVIEPEPVFESDEEDRAAEESMLAEFRALGLVDHRGRVDDDLLDTLAVLARPSVEFFGWYNSHGSRDIGILVAGLGEQAVIVSRLADKVRVGGIRNQSLPETLVAQLPDVPPARIDAVNIRISELQAHEAVDDLDGLLLDARPYVEQDQRTVRQLMAMRETGMGELYVAALDGRGRREMREALRYLDTKAGRALVTKSGDYLSIAPAGPKLLVERLRQAMRDLG